MAVNDFSMVLCVYSADGQPIEPKDFLAGIGVPAAPYEVYGRAEKWHAVGLRIGQLSLGSFKSLPEPHDEYAKAIEACLVGFANWLSRVQEANIAALRARGMELEIIINLEIDSDQMDFHLPHQMSMELGRLKLRLYILSNE